MTSRPALLEMMRFAVTVSTATGDNSTAPGILNYRKRFVKLPYAIDIRRRTVYDLGRPLPDIMNETSGVRRSMRHPLSCIALPT